MTLDPLPSRRSSLAAKILHAWYSWRFTKALRDLLVDAGVLAGMLVVWTLGYVALCPPAAPQHHARIAQVQR